MPEYLNAFLNCKYGVLDIKRRARQSINQTNVNPEEVKEIKIPILSMDFQKKIESLTLGANNNIIESDRLYSMAQDTLINELGLEKFNPSIDKISVKTLKDSFLRTGRLDSEYYQKKYEDYLDKVFNYQSGYELLEDCCKLKDKNFMPKDDEMYQYIELANVRENSDIVDCELIAGKDLPTRARRKVNTGDVIISSVAVSYTHLTLPTNREE